MNTEDERRAFLAAILENPDDDTPRLAYADWLDEHGGVEVLPCPKCTPDWRMEKGRGLGWVQCNSDSHERFNIPCAHCGGNDRVNGGILERDNSNAGTGVITRPDSNAARAELIRVQCEWSRLKDIPLPNTRVGRQECRRITQLPAREAAILAEWEDKWRVGPRCGKCGGNGREHGTSPYQECRDCFGSGDTGGLCRLRSDYLSVPGGRPDWLHAVSYSRGMKVVTVPAMSDCAHQVRTMGGHPESHYEWRPTDWLKAVLRWHPDVEAVMCLDRVPLPDARRFGWADLADSPGAIGDPHYLPTELFRHVYPGSTDKTWRYHAWFPTVEAANLALGRATAAWARRPPTRPEE